MNTKILEIQISSDIADLNKDERAGLFINNPEELEKRKKFITDKMSKVCETLQEQAERLQAEAVSEDYPIGNMLEPHDIERDKEL